MHTVYLHLGSNIGDRRAHIFTAISAIDAEVGEVIASSSMFMTEPWGNQDQSYFVNAAIGVTTTLNPIEVLDRCQGIEQRMGRERKEHWGPRVIDIDILLYDDLVIKSDRLTIPHTYMHERNFVLEPLAEIDPSIQHPLLKKSIATLLKESADPGLVLKMKTDI